MCDVYENCGCILSASDKFWRLFQLYMREQWVKLQTRYSRTPVLYSTGLAELRHSNKWSLNNIIDLEMRFVF